MVSQLTYAQSLSLGIRTGIGQTIDMPDISPGESYTTWDKEVYVRIDTRKKLSSELRALHYKYIVTYYYKGFKQNRISNYAKSLSIQYLLVGNDRFKLYPGIDVAAVYYHKKFWVKGTVTDQSYRLYKNTLSFTGFYFGPALNTTYNVTDKVYTSLNTRIMLDVNDYHADDLSSVGTHLSVLLGIGIRTSNVSTNWISVTYAKTQQKVPRETYCAVCTYH